MLTLYLLDAKIKKSLQHSEVEPHYNVTSICFFFVRFVILSLTC